MRVKFTNRKKWSALRRARFQRTMGILLICFSALSYAAGLVPWPGISN